jgi:hypothetical protein
MFGLFRKKLPDNTASIVKELEHVHALIAKLNIPIVADDVDAGYDMAIDEALDMIDGRIKFYLTPTADNTETL